MIFRQNIFASTMQTGRWLKSLVNLLTIQKGCSSPFDSCRCHADRLSCGACCKCSKRGQGCVIGDGAVGQCAVIAAKMRGASQIILMSRHEDRQKMAMESGATAVVAERGQEGITKVREILGGGADAALECVGTEAAIEQALGVLHNGGRMGFVGVPHYNNRALGSTFMQNISVAGGAASATTYDKQFLLKAVLDGDINPGRVFTSSYKLEDIDQAYKDMDERKSIKSMIVIE